MSVDDPAPADDPYGGFGDDYALDVDFGDSRGPQGPGRGPDRAADSSPSSTRSGDRGGLSPPPSSSGSSSDGSPYSFVDETGSSPGPSGPSSGSPGSPGSPSGSSGPGSSAPGSPPSSPPPSGPPSIPSRSPGSPGSPGGGSSPITPFSPLDPGDGRRPRWETDRDRRRDDEELEAVGPWDIGFSNPIASGAEVLFGGFGGPAPVDEGSAEGGPIDETGGFGP